MTESTQSKTLPEKREEIASIRAVAERYLEAARKGQSRIFASDMLPTTRIQGHLKGAFVDLSAEEFLAHIDQSGPAAGLQAEVESIDVAGTAASLRLDCEGWHGVHYSDFMTLVKLGGVWKIAGKVFDAHRNR